MQRFNSLHTLSKTFSINCAMMQHAVFNKDRFINVCSAPTQLTLHLIYINMSEANMEMVWHLNMARNLTGLQKMHRHMRKCDACQKVIVNKRQMQLKVTKALYKK